jgi:hypothetical protein
VQLCLVEQGVTDYLYRGQKGMFGLHFFWQVVVSLWQMDSPLIKIVSTKGRSRKKYIPLDLKAKVNICTYFPAYETRKRKCSVEGMQLHIFVRTA